MSKYRAIIDLPDNSRCDGCKFLKKTGKCRITRSGIWNYSTDNEDCYWSRPTDCPLIPVDRAIERMRRGISRGTPSNEEEAAELAEHFLREELGVTE